MFWVFSSIGFQVYGVRRSRKDKHKLFFLTFSVATSDLQAEDRVHRIGQTKEVLVLRLAVKGTVDETILNIATKKHGRNEKVLGENRADYFATQSSSVVIKQRNENALGTDYAYARIHGVQCQPYHCRRAQERRHQAYRLCHLF